VSRIHGIAFFQRGERATKVELSTRLLLWRKGAAAQPDLYPIAALDDELRCGTLDVAARPEHVPGTRCRLGPPIEDPDPVHTTTDDSRVRETRPIDDQSDELENNEEQE
jgi:hypothetical protein